MDRIGRMRSRSVSRTTIAVLLLLAASPVGADSWGPPTKEHWSNNGRWALVLGFAGGNTLSLCQKTDDGLKEYWRRGYVHRVWPPHLAYVADDGQYIVLKDVYHNLGYGNVIVVLGPHGKVLGSYQLSDLLSPNEIRDTPHSVSSIWWSRGARFSLLDSDRTFAFITQQGTLRCFDLPTGSLLDPDQNERQRIVDELFPELDAWLESDDPSQRVRGMTLLGGLKTERAIATAQRLLHDRTPTKKIKQDNEGETDLYGVQAAAAKALLRLKGTAAIASLEPLLDQTNAPTRASLLASLSDVDHVGYRRVETADTPVLIAMWERLAEHPAADVRNKALVERLQRDDGSYVLKYPDLVDSETTAIRGAAVRSLIQSDSPDVIPLLATRLKDPDRLIRRSALQNLVDRKLPGIETILAAHLDDDFQAIRTDVICRLAPRRHPAALEKLNQTILRWRTLDQENQDWLQQNEIETLCQLIANRKLFETRDALRQAQVTDFEKASPFITGALAALGDSTARDTLHHLAQNGDVRQRFHAIEMCRYLGDPQSAFIVQQASQSQDRHMRQAATRELPKFDD